MYNNSNVKWLNHILWVCYVCIRCHIKWWQWSCWASNALKGRSSYYVWMNIKSAFRSVCLHLLWHWISLHSAYCSESFQYAEWQTHARVSFPPCGPFAWHITRWAITMGWVTTAAGINTVLQSRLSSALYNIYALLFLKIKATVTCLSFKRPAAALLSLYMLHIPLLTTRQRSLRWALQASGR